MSSRDTILAAVKTSQPIFVAFPDTDQFGSSQKDLTDTYIPAVSTAGGTAVQVNDTSEILPILRGRYGLAAKIFNAATARVESLDSSTDLSSAQFLKDIDIAIINGQFGVAENGAVWLTDVEMVYRPLPFICQHLVLVLEASALVATMHEAYKRTGSAQYGFGTFIAGPSKTADIEQSLVIGAHGPRSLTVFLVGKTD